LKEAKRIGFNMEKPQEHSLSPSAERIRFLLDRYAAFVAQAGKTVRRASPDKLQSIILSLDDAQKSRMIARLETEISVFEEMVRAKEALANPDRQLWRYLLTTKQIPCSDLFDKIKQTDTIQVFGIDHRLLFTSLNFYDYVSFTLEQLLTETWHQAVKRDQHVTEELYRELMLILSGEIRHTVEGKVPSHLVEEVGTESLIKTYLRVKWMSPTFSNDKSSHQVAIISIVELLRA
jgi:hypothetical protein